MENKAELAITPIPDDINLESRKDIIRRELRKLIGKPLTQKEFLEKQRIKNIEFKKKSARRKLAQASQRRNRG